MSVRLPNSSRQCTALPFSTPRVHYTLYIQPRAFPPFTLGLPCFKNEQKRVKTKTNKRTLWYRGANILVLAVHTTLQPVPSRSEDTSYSPELLYNRSAKANGWDNKDRGKNKDVCCDKRYLYLYKSCILYM